METPQPTQLALSEPVTIDYTYDPLNRLANHPKLLLADESTGELDSTTSREILQLFQHIVETEHITMLMSSHDPLVDKYVDEIVLLKDGQISSPNGL